MDPDRAAHYILVMRSGPNLVLDSGYSENKGPSNWLNPAAFSPNGPGTYGNVGRDSLRGPTTVNFDVALSRAFRFTERWQIEARAEAFNAINHAN